MWLNADIMANFRKEIGHDIADFIMAVLMVVPPVGQVKACSVLKVAPQTHSLGRLVGVQP